MSADYMPRNRTPNNIAAAAPIIVLKKFTTSFVIQAIPSFSCSVAPNKLSHMVAKKAENVATPTPLIEGIKPTTK